MIGIYALAHPETGEIRYVGLTRDLRRRQQSYRHRAHTRHLDHWLRSLPAPVEMRTLEQVEDDVADERERYWIAELRKTCRLLNFTDGGERGYSLVGRKGRSRTAAEKAGVSALQRARLAAGVHPFQDPTIRERQRQASSIANRCSKPWVSALLRERNLHQSTEQRDAIRAANRKRAGVPLTAEHRAKVAAGMRAYRNRVREARDLTSVSLPTDPRS